MQYQDFKIRIEGKRGDGYDISVESPAGNAEENIVFDFDATAISGQIKQLGRTVRGVVRDVEIDITDGPSPAEIGEQLFNSLFQGSIAKMYYQSYRDLTDPEVGLRIKLHLNLNDPDVSALAAVPWEYIREAANMEYLNLSKQTPLVRFLDVQRPNTVLPLNDALTVLVVMSNPAGVHALDLDAEKKLIEESWAKEPGVDVHFLTQPTSQRLHEKLSEHRFHVLHYMGHGAHDPKSGIGGLVLEDDSGNAEVMDAETLGRLLRNEPSLRLVFLNACDTAKMDEQRPFAGVTNRLVMAGVPAVVAMQFPISDTAAISFAKAFYSRLVAGAPVDEATTFGRMAIAVSDPKSLEWGTPVLCMRSPDGRLFELKETTPAATGDSGSPSPAPEATTSHNAAPAQASSGGMMKIALGAAGVVLAAVAAFFLLNFDDDYDFEWKTARSTLQVGVPQEIELRLVETEGDNEKTFKTSSPDYTVEIASSSDNLVKPERLAPTEWRWRTTAIDPGNATLRAKITDVRAGKSFERELTIPASVGEQVRQRFESTMESVTSPDSSSAEVLQALKALSQPQQLSSTMRATLKETLSGMEETVALQNAAFATAEDSVSTLTEKIAALKAWRDRFQDVRYDPATGAGHPLQQRLAELQSRTNIDKVIVCGQFERCTDSVARLKVNAPVYVSTTPGAAGLKCEITGPQTKDCTLENSFRTMNLKGDYHVEITNAQGDLLARQPLEIY